MFFDNWTGILRVAIVGTCAYAFLVVILRTSGKRTLAKLSAFDLVVTVAIGSLLATVLISKDVPLAEGVTAFIVLTTLQWIASWISLRSSAFGRLIRGAPTSLFRHGELIEDELVKHRITEQDVLAAVRAQGIADLADVAEVVLETDGSISVVELPWIKSPRLQIERSSCKSLS